MTRAGDGLRTALIVGDVQTGIIREFRFARPVVSVLAQTIPMARRAGVHIVYLRAGLRPNGTDVHPNNAVMQQFHAMADVFHETSDDTWIDDALTVDPADSVVLKRRASGFAGTDLDLVLRSQRIDRVAICGVASSAVVAATVYAAADLDYEVSVLSDACADPDPAAHQFLMETLFPARGVAVSTAGEWLGRDRGPALEPPPRGPEPPGVH
ncbi:isochorismatase family cysteine hydrolase [Rhodococcus sp. IEGM 1330]|uniref:cysteine hydrolase family protein n=1 Tax=Rhodococcus sp. IEGM 1330 TaxID=3082225 RepID=UPI0029552B14|nr:isochorismatase family cysteine hydrolase [Rhodococcus sp. IEGM 1330]MDV8020094.1 isochorismatase family cysteine hydrolase [Rhodococcus sp. IEGM 1330]